MKKTVPWILIYVVIVVAGCATTSTMTPTSQTGKVSVLEKDIPLSVEVKGKEEYREEVSLLQKELVQQLKESKFNVVDNVARRLLVDMTHLRKVGGGSRFFLGPLAGNAEVNVAVKVVEGEKTMSDFVLNTSATDWSGFAGTTEQTLAKVAERISAILQDSEEAKKYSGPR